MTEEKENIKKVKFNSGITEAELYVRVKETLYLSRRTHDNIIYFDCLMDYFSFLSNSMTKSETDECLEHRKKCLVGLTSEQLERSGKKVFTRSDLNTDLFELELKLNRIAKRIGLSNPEKADTRFAMMEED